jgi:hypothetical protein
MWSDLESPGFQSSRMEQMPILWSASLSMGVVGMITDEALKQIPIK